MKTALLAVLLMACTAPLAGQGGRHLPEDDDVVRVVDRRVHQIVFSFTPDRVLTHARRLGITDEQREGLNREIDHARRAFRPLVDHLVDAKKSLDDVMRVVPVDEDDAVAALDRVLVLEDDLKRLQLRLQLRTYNLLTEAQRIRFQLLEENGP